MNDLNSCSFIGRLGNDPETSHTVNGMAITKFNIAVGWKTKDKEGVEWVRVTAFNKLAEICGQYLNKGSQVFIEGRMKTDKWQNKDGVDQYTTGIAANNMQMLGGKPVSAPAQQQAPQQAPQRAPQQAPPPPPVDSFDDDAPF